MKRTLQIRYRGFMGRSPEMDRKIDAFATLLGIREYARGYSFDFDERDFAFDLEQVPETQGAKK